MQNLKHVRVVLSLLFFLEGCAFLVWGTLAPAHTAITRQVQIIPSAIATSMGATLLWIVATLLLGRVYCSSVCPIGTLQDIFTRLGAIARFKRPRLYSYKPPKRFRFDILIVYILLVIASGAALGATLVEPWNIFSNIVGLWSKNAAQAAPVILADKAFMGVIIGVASLMILLAYSLLSGRDFCNHICPIGTLLGIVSSRSALHIELDTNKCTSCLQCENVCKASCISIKERIIDNSRCVRCFNCVAECPEHAIRYQANRNGIISPLMRRVGESVSNMNRNS